MVRDEVDPDPILGTMSVRSQYFLEGSPDTVGHTHSHTHSHLGGQSGNPSSMILGGGKDLRESQANTGEGIKLI